MDPFKVTPPPGGGGSFGPNAVPTGAYSVATAGADLTGAVDSTTQVAAAIDTVLNNNNTYKTVWFPANAVVKMNNMITRLNIPTGTTLNIQGGPGAVIDARSNTDQCVLYLGGGLGNTLPYGSSLASAITAGDQTITLFAGGVATLGLTYGDKMLITTQPFADTRSTTSNNITSGSTAVTVASAIFANGVSIKTYPNAFPDGTTVSSGGGTTSLVMSKPALFTPGSGTPVFENSTNWLFDTFRPTYYKGEIVTVPLQTEATAPAPINGQVITLKRNAYDSYTTANTTIYKVNMPTITIDGVSFLRTNNGVTGKFGYRIEYASPGGISNLSGQGATSTLYYCDTWDGGRIENCFGQDFWFSGGTNCYGIAIYASQDLLVKGNRIFGGRHAITSGGGLAVVRGCNYVHNVVSNVDSSASCFDMHDTVELCNVEGNVVYDGMGVSCSNSRIVNNHIESRATEGLVWLPTRTQDYMVIKDNTVSVILPGIDGIGLKLSTNVVGTVGVVDVSGNTVRSTSACIRIYPTQSYNYGMTLDRVTLTNNDCITTATNAEALQIARTKSTSSTSTTSLSIAVGSTTFTLASGVAANLFPVGLRVRAQRAGANSASFMEGAVTATLTGPERVTINVDLVGNNGAGPFTDWDLTVNADVTINSCEIIGGRYQSGGFDGATIQAHYATGIFRAKGVRFVQGRTSGSPINGLAGFGFKDYWFESCYFGATGSGTGDNRGSIFWNNGILTFRDCEFDTFARQCGVNLPGITAGTDAPLQLTVINPKYTGTVTGIFIAPATTSIREWRENGALLVAGDWVATGWGASAVVTTSGTSYRGTVTVTTNVADTAGANPTLTLTVKDRGFSTAPVAVCQFDHTSTGPTATPGIGTCMVNGVQTAAGSATTNSTSKMIIKYNGTPTATSAKTYIFPFHLTG